MEKIIKDDCIFCQLANHKIPTHMVYEDDVVAAFLDNGQVTRGHTLLVPKYHLATIFDYTEEDAREIFARVPKIVHAVRAAFPESKGLNLLNNNGEIAAQSIFHSHIHIIPRYSRHENFNLTWNPSPEGTYTEDDMEAMAEAIRKNIEE